MNTNMFLRKQGIEASPPFMKVHERLSQKFSDLGVDLGAYDPFPFPTIIGSFNCDFVQLTLHEGEIINRKVLIETSDDRLIIQQQKHCGRIQQCLDLEDSLKLRFSELRTKWHIPVDDQRAFFYELSSGYHDLFLPNVVVDEDLKADVRDLCGRLELRGQSNEEFGMVAAYLLFGEFIEQEDVGIFSIHSPRLFKVITQQGYKLFLELLPSLQEMTWAKLYKGTRGALKERGFVPGEGNMRLLSELAEAIPEEFGHCHVFAIPRGVWKIFEPVRSYIDGVYGENYILHNEELSDKSKFVINQFAKASLEEIPYNMELYLKISNLVSHAFRPEGSNRDIEYSVSAVINVLMRYPDLIEKEKQIQLRTKS